MNATLRIGAVQHAALSMYVFDPCHGDPENGDAPFPGTLSESSLTVDLDQCDAAISRLIEAVNSADDDGDREFCEALSALTPRVRRASVDLAQKSA